MNQERSDQRQILNTASLFQLDHCTGTVQYNKLQCSVFVSVESNLSFFAIHFVTSNIATWL